jgi:transposase-like protein
LIKPVRRFDDGIHGPAFDGVSNIHWKTDMVLFRRDQPGIPLRRQRLKRAADLVDDCVGETLTYYAFPDSHWIKLKTNNPLGQLMREIRRRTKVVGAFPDGQSCLNLAAARLRHIAGTQWSTRRYMNMEPLNQLKLQRTGAAVA